MRSLALFLCLLVLAGCGGGEAESVTAELLDVRSFEPVGTVTLEEIDGRTRVEVVASEVSSASAPAIRGGFCAELRPRDRKLSEFRNGRSVTELDMRLEDILERQAKVTVSRGARTPHQVAACAELPFEGVEPEVVPVDLLGPRGTDKGLAWLEPSRQARTRVGILLYDVVRGPVEAAITTGGCTGERAHTLAAIRESESLTELEARLDALADGGHWVVAGSACGRIESD